MADNPKSLASLADELAQERYDAAFAVLYREVRDDGPRKKGQAAWTPSVTHMILQEMFDAMHDVGPRPNLTDLSLADDLERATEAAETYAREATNAMLADELERHAKHPSVNVNWDFTRTLRKAAAALRAPTIAVTDEMVDAALTEYVGEPPFEDYFGEEGVGPHRLNMRAALETALSTTSPTIAAPSPSNEVTPEMVEAAKRILFHETEECDEEVRLAIAAALKARKPSPSNEVTPEMVEGFNRFVRVVLKESCWPAITVRRAIEAALRACK